MIPRLRIVLPLLGLLLALLPVGAFAQGAAGVRTAEEFSADLVDPLLEVLGLREHLQNGLGHLGAGSSGRWRHFVRGGGRTGDQKKQDGGSEDFATESRFRTQAPRPRLLVACARAVPGLGEGGSMEAELGNHGLPMKRTAEPRPAFDPSRGA